MSNRQLKFRAWDYGHNTMSYKVNLYSINSSGVINRAQLDMQQVMKSVRFHCEVMQWTGREDQAGKEIYESDIIKLVYDSNIVAPEKTEVLLLVKYFPNHTHYAAIPIDGTQGTFSVGFSGSAVKSYLVVGNIYENPGLLPESFKNED